MLLEIATFNYQSALLAANAGANRIELCENIHEGGTTPSYGTLKQARENISIPIFPIIRPRGGDFFFSDDEFKIMQSDVLLCKQLGFEGVVIGLLNQNATVDIKRTSQLVEFAYPMDVTFHRAFDRTVDPFKALEDVINCGCIRILTSGQKPFAIDGIDLIKELIHQADERIKVMPGSGVRKNNIKQLVEETGAIELHSSARKLIPTSMLFNQIFMSENLENLTVSEDEIKSMILQFNS